LKRRSHSRSRLNSGNTESSTLPVFLGENTRYASVLLQQKPRGARLLPGFCPRNRCDQASRFPEYPTGNSRNRRIDGFCPRNRHPPSQSIPNAPSTEVPPTARRKRRAVPWEPSGLEALGSSRRTHECVLLAWALLGADRNDLRSLATRLRRVALGECALSCILRRNPKSSPTSQTLCDATESPRH